MNIGDSLFDDDQSSKKSSSGSLEEDGLEETYEQGEENVEDEPENDEYPETGSQPQPAAEAEENEYTEHPREGEGNESSRSDSESPPEEAEGVTSQSVADEVQELVPAYASNTIFASSPTTKSSTNATPFVFGTAPSAFASANPFSTGAKGSSPFAALSHDISFGNPFASVSADPTSSVFSASSGTAETKNGNLNEDPNTDANETHEAVPYEAPAVDQNDNVEPTHEPAAETCDGVAIDDSNPEDPNTNASPPEHETVPNDAHDDEAVADDNVESAHEATAEICNAGEAVSVLNEENEDEKCDNDNVDVNLGDSEGCINALVEAHVEHSEPTMADDRLNEEDETYPTEEVLEKLDEEEKGEALDESTSEDKVHDQEDTANEMRIGDQYTVVATEADTSCISGQDNEENARNSSSHEPNLPADPLVEALRQEITLIKQSHEVEIESLKNSHLEALEKQRAAGTEDLRVIVVKTSAEVETLKQELEFMKSQREAAENDRNALAMEIEDAEQQIAHLKSEIETNPRHQRVVDGLHKRLEEWFEDYRSQQELFVINYLRGIDGDALSEANEEDAVAAQKPLDMPEYATDAPMAPNECDTGNIGDLCTSTSLMVARSVQALRNVFATQLLVLGKRYQVMAIENCATRAELGSRDAYVAELQMRLQQASETIAQQKKSENAQIVSLQSRLDDKQSESATLQKALEESKEALSRANVATIESSDKLDKMSKRYASLLAAKEDLAAELSAEKQAHQLAIRQMKVALDSQQASRVEEVTHLKRQISNLTVIATECAAKSAASEREITRLKSQAASDLLSTELATAEPRAKAPRVEVMTDPNNTHESKIRNGQPHPIANESSGYSDSREVAEVLLARSPPRAHLDGPVMSTKAFPDDPAVSNLRSLANSLGLPRVSDDVLGAKRSRGLQSTSPVAGAPTFLEASAFFVKGREHIAAVEKENRQLRACLDKSLKSESKLKAFEASRSETVASFAALSEEIEHLRADNKHIRDELAGTREENKVLSNQLVSIMMSGLSNLEAEAVASPIAPLPPATTFPHDSTVQSPRLQPLPTPSASRPNNEKSARVKAIVSDSLETIRRCATEMSARNSSTTTNPEVQAAAARQLQNVKNETLRLTRYKDGLMKLIEPRERRLASVTANLVRLASREHSVCDAHEAHGEGGAINGNLQRGVSVSPSKPAHVIAAEALDHSSSGVAVKTDGVQMSSSFTQEQCIEAAIALALGFAHEHLSLADEPPFLLENVGELSVASRLAPATTIASRISSPALKPSAPTAVSNVFVADLLTKMAKLSSEVEVLRTKKSGEKGSAGAREALESSQQTAQLREHAINKQNLSAAMSTIKDLKKELKAADKRIANANAERTSALERSLKLRTLIGVLCESSNLTASACLSVAEAAQASATSVTKWRESALNISNLRDTADNPEQSDSSTLREAVSAASSLRTYFSEAIDVINLSATTCEDVPRLILICSALCGILNNADAATCKSLSGAVTAAENAAIAILREKLTAQSMISLENNCDMLSDNVEEPASKSDDTATANEEM